MTGFRIVAPGHASRNDRRSGTMRLAFVCLSLVAALAAGCATATPDVKVIGVSEARAHRGSPDSERVLVLFVEVINDTARELRLSRLNYRMAADRWFTHDGVMPLSRTLLAHSSAVVEVPVPWVGHSAGAAVPYQLNGTLVAVDERIERSFKVKASGTLEPGRIAVGESPRTRMRVAGEP
jgi:hypothetical protein